MSSAGSVIGGSTISSRRCYLSLQILPVNINRHSEIAPSKFYHAHNISMQTDRCMLLCVCGDDWDTAFLAEIRKEQPVEDGGSVVRMMLQ